MPIIEVTIIEKLQHIFGNQTAIAAVCGITKQGVSNWKGRVPADHVRKLVTAAKKLDRGKLTEHEIRPDVFPKPD